MIFYRCSMCSNLSEQMPKAHCKVCGSNQFKKVSEIPYYVRLSHPITNKVVLFYRKNETFDKNRALMFGELGKEVGRSQFKIYFSEDKVLISKGDDFKLPTLVNGSELGEQPVALKNNDRIVVGALELIVYIEYNERVIEVINV